MSSTDDGTSIELLEESVISGIAAGEVVERPASIVKELVENSLDAGAKRISIAYGDEDGIEIAVTDDGEGIAVTDVDLAVTRHATSKLKNLDDLSRIHSFGFRGEALASIAAISDFRLTSRARGADRGAFRRLKDGYIRETDEVAARVGTEIRIGRLFENVPARRKFLKSASAEYSAVADRVKKFALAHASVHFELTRNGKRVLDLPPVSGLADRVRQVYGRDVATSMRECRGKYAGIELEGLISDAGVAYGSARRIALFVNGRAVQDKLLFRAVMEAYRTYLVRSKYPAAVLFVTLDPTLVDVNVHPAKAEVRFAEPDAIQRLVIETLQETLRNVASPLGRWAGDERSAARIRAREIRREARRPGTRANKTLSKAARTVNDPRFSVGEAAPERTRESASEKAGEELPGYQASGVVADAVQSYEVGSGADAHEEQVALELPANSMGDWHIVGQVFAGYLVCETGDRLVLIDQHAAHERVLFEKLMEGYERSNVPSQGLLIPENITVGAEGTEAISKNVEALGKLGWDLDAFGDDTVVVRAVPAIASDISVPILIERLAEDLVATGGELGAKRVVERVMASVACHSAIRVGKKLDRRGAESVLAQIASVDFASSCPHGRPVSRVLERSEVERMFGRT